MRNCVQVFLLEWRTDKANDNFKKINRMKKFITLMILSAICLGAKAQQINGDFSTWEKCYPWVAGKCVTSDVGTQPQGWHASNVYGANGMGKNDRFITQVSGHADGYTGVKIQNVYVGMKIPLLGSFGSWAPGYLSLGTPWNTSKGTNEESKDGGCFGGMSFVYKPDAIAFNYKFSMTQSKASFVGYLWKGTWTQTNVPSNTTSSGDPSTAIIIDRDVCVLGKYDASKHKGDTPTSTADAKLIASYETYVESSVENWTACEIPFTYVDDDATPEKINIIFSSADYFSTTGAGTDDASINDTRDVLTIDNVKLIYYHSLAKCTYDGQPVSFDDNNSASVSALYDENKLAYVKKGVGAKVEKAYDNATGVLTITVKGNDYDADNTSVTTYTIQFATASATLAVNSAAQYGTFCAPFDVTIPEGVQAFTIGGIDKNGILTLEQQNTISAHTPVIVYSESASDINAVQFGVATAGNPTSNYLTGVYTDTKAPVGSYVLQNQRGRVGFYKVQEGIQPMVRANRAYLTVPASANVKAFYMDDATAIQTVEELLSGKAEIYDLAGRRQQKLQKGINIVGGKKVLVK